MTILITGASGFVGQNLCSYLEAEDDRNLLMTSRREREHPAWRVLDANDPVPEWLRATEDIDCIIHLAARVHQMQESASDAEERYRKENTEFPVQLAEFAASRGVRRFVFISTIKVLGESTTTHPLNEHSIPNALDEYGRSKWQAETQLRMIAKNTDMELVILRPTLIYGSRAGGNIERMIGLIQRGWPLPFGRIRNQRSMLSVDAFSRLIRICIDHPDARQATFLASDKQPISTTDFVRAIAEGLGQPVRLLPIPRWLQRLSMSMPGVRNIAGRLFGNMHVDSGFTEKTLGWQAEQDTFAGVRSLARNSLEKP